MKLTEEQHKYLEVLSSKYGSAKAQIMLPLMLLCGTTEDGASLAFDVADALNDKRNGIQSARNLVIRAYEDED